MPSPLIATIISDVTPLLLRQIKKGLDRSDTKPDEGLVARAIELLSTLNAFDPARIPTKGAAEFFEMWLKDLLTTPGNPDPKLDAETLQQLFKKCFGAPFGTDMLPRNRPTIPAPSENDGKKIDYLFEVDTASIPSLAGISKADFVDLVNGAWQRWLKRGVVDRRKLRVRQKTDDIAAAPNLTIGFGALDGTGGKLAETETRWSSDAPSQYTIQFDLNESWTESKLMATMVHEIGHALGLEHVHDASGIMAEFLDPTFSTRPLNQVVLQAADVAALTEQRTPWI